ncbi:MAG: LysR family transcriptional regulator, partial [Anaerolineales bacterium]|nr:LysR family transcriptional regulator [Anaerolineales bacterium]
SVSQHIKALEKHFGEVLFIRQGRSLILSDAGRVLIPLARQFVVQSTRINETMSSLKGHIKGRIRLGCNAESGKYILPEFFTQFYRKYPEVTIVCETDGCSSPLESLRRGTQHFIVTNQDKGIDSCFEVHQLLTEKITLITPRNHLWAGRDNIDVEDLLTAENFILPAGNTNTYDKVNAALAEKNLSLLQLNSSLTLSNTEAIVLSVDKGLGVSFSSTIISSLIGNVVSIPINGLEIKRELSIVQDKTQLSTAARDAFWEFMTASSDKIKELAGV